MDYEYYAALIIGPYEQGKIYWGTYPSFDGYKRRLQNAVETIKGLREDKCCDGDGRCHRCELPHEC